jgi:hypothetical protein
MEKIPTLFERDPTTRKVTAARAVELPELVGSLVTEKVDGQNVRLTVRHGELVRIEARKKPHKTQKERAKAAGAVIDPWYREAWIFGGEDPTKADQYIVDAAGNTDLAAIPDGEWSGEAVGPAIQGNPLDLEQREVILFSYAPTLVSRLGFTAEHGPNGLELGELAEWMRDTRSLVSNGKPIEGIVLWQPGREWQPVGKLTAKDLA